jgi:hypothetical protein
MKQFQEISSRMKVGKEMYVPGEHDAGLDGGQLYREFFKETYYSFDHRGRALYRARQRIPSQARDWT